MWIAQFIILMILEVNTYNYNTTISNNETSLDHSVPLYPLRKFHRNGPHYAKALKYVQWTRLMAKRPATQCKWPATGWVEITLKIVSR